LRVVVCMRSLCCFYSLLLFSFVLLSRPPLTSTLFPYTTLFRSAFVLFVLFCMKYVWPPLMAAIEKRQKEIANGLASAERAHKDLDRKSTRLNSSHVSISYAVFCLKKKKKK